MSNSLESNPLVTRWTLLILQLNSLVDAGKSLPITDVGTHIDDGSILEWLAHAFPGPELDLSIYQQSDLYKPAKMVDFLQRLHNAYGPRKKFGVERNGLCMLIAYCNEAVQEGGDV
jgi:hypothetical protein